MIRIGFVGTRHGMSPPQCDAVVELVRRLSTVDVVVGHHAGLAGADEDFEDIVMTSALGVVVHPGRQLGPLATRRIVDLATVMVAAPFAPVHDFVDEAWLAAAYAMRERKPVALVPPDGSATRFTGDWSLLNQPAEVAR